MGRLVGGGPVATEHTPLGVAPPLTMQVPGVGQPPGTIPVGKATVAGPVAQGGDGGPVKVATLTTGRVGVQAAVPGPPAVAKGSGRALLAPAIGPTHPPHVAHVGVGRVHVTADVRRRAGAPTVVEVAPTSAFASPAGDPARPAGPLETVVPAGPLLVRGVATGGVVEVATKVPVAGTPGVVASRAVAGDAPPRAAGHFVVVADGATHSAP